MAIIGYGRVSTKEQDLSSQKEQLEKYGCEIIFMERGRVLKMRIYNGNVIFTHK